MNYRLILRAGGKSLHYADPGAKVTLCGKPIGADGLTVKLGQHPRAKGCWPCLTARMRRWKQCMRSGA